MNMPTTGTGAERSNASSLMRLRVWQVGVLASVAAAVATELFALGAEAIDIPMEVDGEEIPFGGFAMITLLWSVVGTVLAVALARWAKSPARTFVVTTVVLTLLSLVFPFTLPQAIPFRPKRTGTAGATTVQFPPRPRSNRRNSPLVEFQSAPIPTINCVQSSGTPAPYPVAVNRRIER